MKCLIRTCPWNEERYQWARDLYSALPNAQLVCDRTRNGWQTMLDALERQGTEDAWLK